jgi:predicted Zn-dependent peptidase
MEDVGGEINAYTTKEETVVYSSFFKDYYPRAFDIISDIAFFSTFPDAELKKEKEVILDEINSYRDTPSELIFDEFEEILFNGDPMGRNTLGNTSTLKKLSSMQLKDFMTRNYSTHAMIVASVGNISFSRLIRLFERYFSDAPFRQSTPRLPVQFSYKPSIKKIDRKTYQAHCIIGNTAYDIRNEKRIPLSLLNNIIGGPGMNSRLNLALRERKGYAYSVDSIYTAYSDTGNISIYFGSDKLLVEKCIAIIINELKKLSTIRLSGLQLHKAKRQLMGQIAISADINENFMLTMGKSYMVFDKMDDLSEPQRKIDGITPDEVLEVACEVFNPTGLSYIMYI